jgi:hypothetical protein
MKGNSAGYEQNAGGKRKKHGEEREKDILPEKLICQ